MASVPGAPKPVQSRGSGPPFVRESTEQVCCVGDGPHFLPCERLGIVQCPVGCFPSLLLCLADPPPFATESTVFR